ncbi:MAG: lytic murein transglycosylase B [Rhodocyclaceae bacterium]|nr:lytic murein transglycosylase B [Rhodocyclaceae bacterium]
MPARLVAARLIAALFATSLAATASADVPDLASHPEAEAFVARMVEQHGFDRGEVLAELSAASYQRKAIRYIQPSKTKSTRSWQRYRARFIEPVRIRAGLDFWAAHRDELARAEARYGVPGEIVLGILGVETIFGRNTGAFPLVGALATLAFDYPPRAALFQKELESLFLLARESGRSPSSYTGSYAGAIGYPQFLPSSVRSYAVDFDADGQIDLEGSPADAIGSIARYLAEHGWSAGARVADPVVPGDKADLGALIAAGIEPALGAAELAPAGLRLPDGIGAATLVDLETPGQATEYWLGYRNFYVLTRYNRSSFYAMAVFQLATALREARLGAAVATSNR